MNRKGKVNMQKTLLIIIDNLLINLYTINQTYSVQVI